MNRLARLWPIRRRVDPAEVLDFRIKGRPENHHIEAGTPLADAKYRGAIVLFETDNPERYMLGEARDADGKLIALICGWTSYSLGHVADADGNVREKRRAAAWGWRVEGDGAPVADADRDDAEPAP
ncbi:MAG: hypothetical protein ABI780_01755 [Ardenticatenales bacterium]